MSSSIRVLLVDDEHSFRRPVVSRLIGQGFDVEEAASGPEALARAHACGGNYHVAVIDQVMGPPNGIDTMRQLLQFYPNIEVIILTGWGDMEPGMQALEMGAYRYMGKPFTNVEELALNIETAARFGRERQGRLSLQALVRAGQEINSAHSEEDLYLRLYEAAHELLPVLDGFLVTEYDEQNRMVSFPFAFIHGIRQNLSSRHNGHGIAEWVLQKAEPLLLPDGDADFRREYGLAPTTIPEGACTSKIVVPLFRGGKVVAAMTAMTYRPGIHYNPEHLKVLQAFANQAVVAIENVRQLEAARALRDAMAALNGQRGKEAVLKAIIGEAHRLINSDFTGLILQNDDGSLHKVRPVIPEDYFDRFEEPRQSNGITRAVIEECQSRIIPDTSSDPGVKDSVRSAGIRSMLAMPLIYGHRVLGVLYAHTFALRYFTPHHVDLWGAFASQAAIALHSALEEEREAERMVLHETRLREELGRTQKRLERHMFLVWVSMLEDTWRHSLLQKAVSIQNYAAALGKRLDRMDGTPREMAGVEETLGEIDRLASEIAKAPVRVPQSWETEVELFPLAPLLREVARRESRPAQLKAGRLVEIEVETEALGGVLMQGYRRWIIYALEVLLQNAGRATPPGGKITVSGRRIGRWAEIRILDSGTGVPDAIRGRLFKETVPRDQDSIGMGIGCLLAATIIEEHEGSIELEKTGANGTTVLLRVPLAGEAKR